MGAFSWQDTPMPSPTTAQLRRSLFVNANGIFELETETEPNTQMPVPVVSHNINDRWRALLQKAVQPL
ncbi:MAG: hypothetical protein WCG83_05380 [Candidatus Peregrinibacteria bacterium]